MVKITKRDWIKQFVQKRFPNRAFRLYPIGGDYFVEFETPTETYKFIEAEEQSNCDPEKQ